MKKFINLILCLSLVLSLVSFEGFTADEEIIYKTSFENGIDDWTYYGKISPDFVKFTASCSTDGEKSVYISDIVDDTSIGIISPYFNVEGGNTYSAIVDSYRMSGQIKIYFKYFDKSKKQLFNKSSIAKEGKWQNIVASYTAPDDAKYAQIYLCTDSSNFGDGYFDNFLFVKGARKILEPVNGTYPAKPESFKQEKVEDGIADGTLLFSDSFEEGFSNWTYYNKSSEEYIKETDEDVFDGKKAVFIKDPDEKIATGIMSPYIPATSGNTYTASFYIKNISGSSTRLYMRFFDKDKKRLQNQSFGQASGSWYPVCGSLVAPENTEFCQILIVGNTSQIGEAYVDKVELYKGVYTPQLPKKDYVPPVQTAPVDAKIVAPYDNKLVYNVYNEQGDKLSDFSYAGFYGGDYELPVTENLNVVETLSPSGEKDDSAYIQAAIDKWERKDGIINVIKLKSGTYNIGRKGFTLKSGILLSGEGQGPEGTILYGYDPMQYSVLKISGANPVDVGNKAFITDDYIKSGSKIINISLEDAQNFKVGDKIKIYHNSTKEWADAIKMSGVINVYDNDTTWGEGKVNMVTERVITGISGTEITLDFAFFVPYMKELVPSYITKYDDSGRVENAGVENLRIVSYYNGDKTDESHATNAILISNAKNIFVRDVSSKYFYFAIVKCGSGARNVTIRNCSCLDPVSTIAGARRYSFHAGAGSQQILCTGSYSYDARHDFATSSTATGPIAYVDNIADSSNTSSETHGTWSTGVLYDNLYQIGNDTKGFITLANRGIYGTVLSQGWTSAGCVLWNSLSSTIIVHKPPLTYQNFAVGIWGQYTDEYAKDFKERNINSFKNIYRTGESTEYREENFATDENTSIAGDSYKEALYTPVNPRSLYKAQLSQRYTGVISNAKPNAPVIIYPKYDQKMDNNVEITGLSQFGASKVTVYIDDKPYEAKIEEDNTFSLTLNLADGTHKIYATQTIDGFEGNKTADRFITVNESKGNADYLQSIYKPEQTTMLINDPRPTFDKIINGIKVNINGNLLYSDVLPFETNGRVLVPMRAIFEAFGASVTWDEKTALATAVKDNITVKITENQTTAYVNGASVTLDVPATILNGRFVVPVRFISESFGAKVGWIDETKTVLIEK